MAKKPLYEKERTAYYSRQKAKQRKFDRTLSKLVFPFLALGFVFILIESVVKKHEQEFKTFFLVCIVIFLLYVTYITIDSFKKLKKFKSKNDLNPPKK